VFVLRYVVRNLVIFLYKGIIIVAVLAYFLIAPTAYLPMFVVGIAAILLCGFFFGFAIGMISARYRDVGQLVNSASVFLFFITPVFWKSDRLGDHRWVVDYNPLYHLLSLVRNPLLGLPVSAWSFFMVGLTLSVMFAIWLVVYRKIGRDVVYSL
jgi:ABC-type polysaccharide/polyol phosphate export permease